METITNRRHFVVTGVAKQIGVTPLYDYDDGLYGQIIFLPVDTFPAAVVGSKLDRVEYMIDKKVRHRWEAIR